MPGMVARTSIQATWKAEAPTGKPGPSSEMRRGPFCKSEGRGESPARGSGLSVRQHTHQVSDVYLSSENSQNY